MASKREIGEELGGRWDREAHGYEQQAERDKTLSTVEKRLLQMHARVKRVCANELRLESRKITRG